MSLHRRGRALLEIPGCAALDRHFRSAALLPGLSTYFVLALFPIRELAQPLLLSSGRFSRHAFTITPQEAAVKLLQVAVIHGTMTPTDAAGQVTKLLSPDLPVSRRIEIHETTKAAFEADDDVLEKIKPFLKGAVQNQQTRQQQIGKTVAVTP